MKELDLDELHQAVSKIMVKGGKPKAKKAAGKPTAKKPAAKASKTALPPPKDDGAKAPQSEAARIEVKRPAPRLSIPTRRPGTMDVVQAPKASSVAAPSSRPSRVAPTIAPSTSVTPEPSVAPPPPVVQTAEPSLEVSDDVLASIDMHSKPAAPKLLDQKEEEPTPAPMWPDPIEVASAGPTAPAPKAVPAAQPSPAPTLTTPSEAAAPVQPPTPSAAPQAPAPRAAEEPAEATPFVTTKVEKRPLGAFAGPASPETPPKPPVKEPEQTPSLEQKPQKELSPEVVAVESADTGKFNLDRPIPSQPAPTPESDLNHARQMAIPQQYKTATKQPDETARPVFDTKEYNQPLLAEHVPHRGGKGWLVVTILLLLILMAGAVAYFILFGNFDLSQGL